MGFTHAAIAIFSNVMPFFLLTSNVSISLNLTETKTCVDDCSMLLTYPDTGETLYTSVLMVH